MRKQKTPEQAALELAAVLDEVSANIKDGRCHVSMETARFAIDLLTNRELSQDEAQSMLNMSRYSFENAVAEGRLPQGRRRSTRAGKKVWFLWELKRFLRNTTS